MTDATMERAEAKAPEASEALIRQGQQIMDKAVLLVLVKGQLSTRRSVSRDLVQTEADRQMLSLSKRLLDSNQLRDVLAVDRQAKVYLDSICLPSPFRFGVYLVPLAAVDTVDAKLKEFEQRRGERLEAFLTVYEAAKNEAKEKLQDLYREGDYPPPDGVRRAFKFQWQFVAFNVPDSLSAVSASLFEQERKKAQVQLANAVSDIQLAMREGMKQLVDHMVERLKPGEDGKPKMLIKGFGSDLAEWLGNFDLRNITGDEELGKLVAQARKLAKGVDLDVLRKDPASRDYIAKGFEQIQESLGAMVVSVDRSKRAFTFDEE